MFSKCAVLLSFWLVSAAVRAQTPPPADSLDEDAAALARLVELSEVVVTNNLDVTDFLQRVKNDTTFFKAFRNLRVLEYSSLNDIRMLTKKGKPAASLDSKTRQQISNGCRETSVLSEKTTGNFYDSKGEYNYYTAEMYAGLFFARTKICGETNIVKGAERQVRSKKGLDKHKEQLKMLFFNPGAKIPGIPFMGNKVDIFGKESGRYYDYKIDMEEYEGESCYVFSIIAKEYLTSEEKDRIVIDRMVTWFSRKNYEVLARNYDLSYNAGVYDFNVNMEVKLRRFGKLIVPKTIRYNGDWHAIGKKRERGIFTATLFDFGR